MKYVREDVSHFELKNYAGRLLAGAVPRSAWVDPDAGETGAGGVDRGMSSRACFCACVMHGHGKHILKQQTPLWLAQHPHVMAFHQAPKEYGGDAALLVLIEVEEWQPPELP